MTDPSGYTREIERYLCQKNGGHIIRVVGPAFDLVAGWAAAGVPLKVVLAAIDRCCARREAAGRQRRPLRIEFCEADVLEAFDAWRRAVGVTAGGGAGEDAPAPRRPALAAHVERAIARLAHVRGTGPPQSALHRRIEAVIRELETLAPSAARARGDARQEAIARLAELDRELTSDAAAGLSPEQERTLRAEAQAELAPFGARMPSEARQRAEQAAFERLAREAFHLPVLSYE